MVEESTLLPKEIMNSRGQVVGYYNESDNSYHTKRDKLKGQIFYKKTEFEGKHIENGIAIDREILKRLLLLRCKLIHILIMNEKQIPYTITIEPTKILEKGVKINFDKTNANGICTGFGEQYVFSIDDCTKLNLNQKTL